MNDLNRETIGQFLNDIALWESGYEHPWFSFFAVRRGDSLHLLQGRLFLHIRLPNLPKYGFQSERFVAAAFLLEEVGLTTRVLIEKLIAGELISTPFGNLVLPGDDTGGVSTHILPFHPDVVGGGARTSVLVISGSKRQGYVQQPSADWELKSAEIPFDSLHELLNEFSLGPYKGDFSNVEVVAIPIAEIDLNSAVQGEYAKPAIFLANALSPADCHVGYRILLHGQVIDRGTVNGSQMEWATGDYYKRGVCSVRIPSGAVLQCFAVYRGHAHHQGWVADPELSQNPNRAALEEFDEKLIVLRDYLFEEQKQRKDARDFEVGIAWLLWMLGFSVAHAGATSRTSDATDILATTPEGHMALVECTTGHIKADTKLAKLVERAQTVRRRLDASGNRHIRLLPVIVTTLSREEAKADLDKAEQLGVVVVTSEDVSAALGRSVLRQNADLIFSDAEKSLLSRQNPLGLQSFGQ